MNNLSNFKRDKNMTQANIQNTGSPLFIQQGWQCPICKRVYAPTNLICWYCGNNDVKSSTDTSIVEIKDKEVKDKIIELTTELLGIDSDNINEQDTLSKLGADSLDIVELSMDIEREFGIEFPDEAWDTDHTIGELMQYVVENRRVNK